MERYSSIFDEKWKTKYKKDEDGNSKPVRVNEDGEEEDSPEEEVEEKKSCSKKKDS